MATPFDVWAPSPVRRPARRALIIAGLLLVPVVVIWQLSSQNLGVVAVATAPVGAIGLLLTRDRGEWPMAAQGGSMVGDWEAFKREIDRSRRHERPLTLAAASFPGTAIRGGLLAETVAQARRQMRSIDLLWYDGSGLWLLMPESHREGATTAIRRITEAAPAARTAVWRLVVFPEDALTVGALIKQLDRTPPVDLEGQRSAPAA
ncbi:MAG: hypothetical protein ABR593_07515 [Candidatus Limnocylindria bacterium]